MIFLAKGTFTLARRTRDKDGNIIRDEPARFETNPDGGSVAVGVLDDETMEQIGQAELFGDFDPWGYLGCALKLLSPSRRGNIPDFESILKKMNDENGNADCCLLAWCERPLCQDCIVYQWMEEARE